MLNFKIGLFYNILLTLKTHYQILFKDKDFDHPILREEYKRKSESIVEDREGRQHSTPTNILYVILLLKYLSFLVGS